MTERAFSNKGDKSVDKALIAQFFGLGSNSDSANLTEDEFVNVWLSLERNLKENIEKSESEIKKAKLCVDDSVL